VEPVPGLRAVPKECLQKGEKKKGVQKVGDREMREKKKGLKDGKKGRKESRPKK